MLRKALKLKTAWRQLWI